MARLLSARLFSSSAKGLALGMALSLGLLLSGCPQPVDDTRPEASFTANPRSGNVPLNVTFTDNSTVKGGVIASWLWNFGDGTYSSAPNPVHIYNTAGDFTVSLTVTAASGVDTKTITGFIKATDRSAFATIGAAGGSVLTSGASLTIPAGALAKDTVFGLGQQDTAFRPNAFERITVLSPAYAATRNSASAEVFANAGEGNFTPAYIEIRFEPQGIPISDLNGDHIQILAQLPDGETLPLVSTINGDRVRAELLRLPANARFAVVYRPDAFSVDVPAGSKILTDGNWPSGAKLYLSNEILQQLTALRVGSIQDPVTYQRRNFNGTETGATLAELVSSAAAIQENLVGTGLRPPVLLHGNDRINIVLYDLFAAYDPNYASFGDVLYRDATFGNLTIDPLQLITVARHNAAEVQADAKQVDIAQELGVGNAIWQGVFDAAFLGYDYPRFETGLTSPEGPVNFADAIGEGISTLLGQQADLLGTARTFGENEVAELSEPLLTAFSEDLPHYAVSGQDFFLYIRNRFKPDGSIDYLTNRTSTPAGVLEEVRKEFDVPVIGVPPTADEARLRVYQAMNRSFQKLLGSRLGTLYWVYARDRAVENTTAARLRPSDASRAVNTLNDKLFGPGTAVVTTFDAPTDSAVVGTEEDSALANIPPLSSRAVVFELRPQTSELTLTFNRTDWVADGDNGSVNVKIYKNGQAGQELASTRNSITLRGFTEDPDTCLAKVIVLISNVNIEEANSVTVTASSFSGLVGTESSVLDDYVNACDPDYKWEVRSSIHNPVLGVTVTNLKMTTGAWRGHDDVAQKTWEHTLTIVEPDNVKSDTAMLTINGGSTGNEQSDVPTELLPFATAANTVVAALYAVPNEPQSFTGEDATRTEDEIIAKSYGEYLDSFELRKTDITWPALLPMTRSAIRAMDTVQDYMANDGRVKRNIKDFVVAGASKRGWTTWLTAASDPRVRAIIPIVIDVLHMDEQMKHQLNAYGFYAPAVQDYVAENVFDRLDTAAGKSLLKIVDPISYLNRLNMPKFIANSTGDQFFLPDSSQFYFDQLLGDNTLYYAPNTDHGLSSDVDGIDSNTFKALLSWYYAIIKGIPRPDYTWSFDASNITSVTTNVTPTSVKLWQATNPAARDFRLETIGPKWTATTLTLQNGKYTGTVTAPAKGWTAFFVQLTWDGPIADTPFSASTPVRVIPDVYPTPASN